MPLCLALPFLVIAQQLSEPILQPKTYRSVSGGYELSVDPSTPSGAGQAVYRMSGDGPRWTITHPFTLRDVRVSADGSAAGYGYSSGPGGLSFDEPGEFLVAVLGSDGLVKKLHTIDREPSRFPHGPPTPIVNGLLFQESQDRFVVRVEDGDLNRQSEEWWAFRLSTGELLSKLRPKEHQERTENLRYVLAAVPVPETPLSLIQWYQYDFSRFGTRFALLDDRCRPVWVLDLPEDYTREDSDRSYGFLREVAAQTHGAILRWDEPSRFDLCLAQEGQRVTYEATRDVAGTWHVEEKARRSNSADVVAKGTTPTTTAELALLGTIELDTSGRPLPEVRDVSAFTFDGSGNIAFLRWRQDPWGVDLVYVDADGKLLAKHSFPFFDGENGTIVSDLAWLEADRFAVAWNGWNRADRHPAKLFSVSARTGESRLLAEDLGDEIQSLAALGEGRLAVLGDNRLDVLDREGKRAWSLASKDGLCGADHLAVLRSGRLVLLETTPGGIQWVEPTGRLGRYQKLSEIWSRDPRYPCEIEADVDGGFIVEDADRPVLMDPRGKLVGDIDPRFADGRKVDLCEPVRAGPDGKRWTSDGFAVLRLDADGRVDQIVGEGPEVTRLGDAEAVCLDREDRIHAVAERTGRVFVIDPDGRLVRVLMPDPTDFTQTLVFTSVSLTVDDEGHVYLSSGEDSFGGPTSFVHWGADGRRIGVERLGIDLDSDRWLAQGGTKNRWVLVREGVRLVDANGKTLATLDRRPDGTWLRGIGEASVAPDGSIALLCSSTREQDRALEIVVYAADGAPLRQVRVEAAEEAPQYLAYDGARAVVVVGDRLSVSGMSAEALQELFRLPDVRSGSTNFWTPLLPRGREEVWLFDGEHTIRRYALPRK